MLMAWIIMGLSTGYAAPEKPDTTVTRSAARDGWRYQAALNKVEKRIDASVDYSLADAKELRRAAITQRFIARELISGGATTLDAIIVFRRPLDQNSFEQLVADTNSGQVMGYTLRYLDNQGQRVTINGAPDNGILVPSEMLNTALNDLQQRNPGRFLGWVQMHTLITPQSYNSLVNHPDVYMIDVSSSAIREAFKADLGNDDISIDVNIPQLYWKLEDIHLVSK
jgi:hypothetical protein